MSEEFKSVFLVCLDHNDDMNYVVGRSYSMKKAQKLAQAAEKFWPNNKIYLTVEKIPVNNPLKDFISADESETVSVKASRNPKDVCICGKNPGGCIGSLSCKCSAIARCKRVTEDNPLDFENYSYQAKPILEATFVEVVNIKRGIVEVKIPEWDPGEIIGLSPNEIPSNLRKILKSGLQLIANVNLSAPSVSELVLDNLRYEEPTQDEEIEEIEEVNTPEESSAGVEEVEEIVESSDETSDGTSDGNFEEVEGSDDADLAQ